MAFKSLGYNIVRTCHQPIIPEALDYADEVGLMIYDEWAWAFTTNLNKEAFERNNLVELAENIHRDYNHPSVVMWSCGNEVNYDNRPEVEQTEQASSTHPLDGKRRPTDQQFLWCRIRLRPGPRWIRMCWITIRTWARVALLGLIGRPMSRE